jgi:hypothetical protein
LPFPIQKYKITYPQSSIINLFRSPIPDPRSPIPNLSLPPPAIAWGQSPLRDRPPILSPFKNPKSSILNHQSLPPPAPRLLTLAGLSILIAASLAVKMIRRRLAKTALDARGQV